MEEAITCVNSLKMPVLKDILRARGQYDRGRKPALQDRLIEGLRKDYAEGWQHGKFLNTRIVPFNGQGRDPQELIGLHLKSFQLFARRYGILGGTLKFTDGEDHIIIMRPSHRVAKTQVRVEFEEYWNMSRYTNRGEDEEVWKFWNQKLPDRVTGPAPIVEAVTGIRRNLRDESKSLVLGLRCEGMSKMGFFCCGDAPHNYDTYPSYGDLWLADDEERGSADMRLLHGA